jgi:lipopolysaccharide export system protein LptA
MNNIRKQIIFTRSLFLNRRSILIIAALFVFSSFQHSFAQTGEPINIINADELQYNELDHVAIRKLLGNVQLRQNNVTLFCDRADFYFEQNIVDAFGNVHIKHGDTIDIYGETLHYDGASKKARLNKNVKLTDSRMVLTTEELDYDMNTRMGFYLKGGTLVSDSAVLTSQHGYYYANSADVFFKKNVKLTHPDYVLSTDTLKFNSASRTAYFVSPTVIHSDSFNVYCEGGYYNTQYDIAQFEKNATLSTRTQQLKADTIYYERIKGYGNARSHIRWTDTASNVFMVGDYAQYFENSDRVLATKNAMLITVMDDDSLYITADTLYSYKDTIGNYRNMFGYHHVKIFKSDLQGVCDSVAFSYRDSTFRLYYDPILWVDENQLSADTMSMLLKNNKLYKMNLVQNALAVSESDSGLFNQVQGKNMYGYFNDGRLERMEVQGNGESIYYAKDDSDAYIGVNKVICSNMVIYFSSDRKVDRIFFLTEPDAGLYPINQFPQAESKLKNFKWFISRKPKSKQDLLSPQPLE